MGLFLFLLAASGVLRAANSIEVLPDAQFLIPLAQKVPRSIHKKNPLMASRGHASAPTTVINGVNYDEQYAVNVTIGGQDFSVLVDTAS
jgi:hypothetical protein